MGKPFEIKIDSILGGHSPTSHFAGASQFRASLGIDPAQPIDDSDTAYSTIASGLLRPAASEKFSSSTIAAAPLWIKANPKNSNIYVYDAKGSMYSVDHTLATVTALSDGGTPGLSLGNGFEYYDNYMYGATNTDIMRYGPLNGSPEFIGSYWITTLHTTGLVNTTYPTTFKNNIQIPNHPLHRHSDGILYIGDVVDGQGTIHALQTVKTTVEGDTWSESGTTWAKLYFGYGLHPTSIESYGSDLAVALIENISIGLRQTPAKIAFWDTTSGSFNKIVWVEFPDSLITAMKNVNGVLYVVSGNYKTRGFRITRFIGGYSFEEVYYSETGEPCLQGAIDAVLNRCIFGSHTNIPEAAGCVYATGLQKNSLSTGVFNVMRATGGDSSTCVTSLGFVDATGMGFYTPVIGWTRAGDGSTGMTHGLDKQGTSYSTAPSMFWGQTIRIGQRFKITKIRLPLAQAIGTNMTLTPTIYFDDGTTSMALTTIDNTSYPGVKDIVLRPQGATGGHNFWLELKWTGSALCTVGMPILIDGETIDD
jgi:hypothetical protein